MNIPLRVLVSNCASCVAVISVGPCGRPLSPSRSFDCPPSAEPFFAEAGVGFESGVFAAAAGFAPEAGFCCAAWITVLKQTIAPNKMTHFFTDFNVVDRRCQVLFQIYYDYKSPDGYFRTSFPGEFLN